MEHVSTDPVYTREPVAAVDVPLQKNSLSKGAAEGPDALPLSFQQRLKRVASTTHLVDLAP